jgi:hypothetical protein
MTVAAVLRNWRRSEILIRFHQRDLKNGGYPQPFANNGREKNKCAQLVGACSPN